MDRCVATDGVELVVGDGDWVDTKKNVVPNSAWLELNKPPTRVDKMVADLGKVLALARPERGACDKCKC